MPLTRRAFVTAGGLSVVALGVGGVPAFLGRSAQATASGLAAPGTGGGRRKTLVTIFQRGAMDGLAAVQPIDDPHLARLRPELLLGAGRRTPADERLLELDGTVGLHPALGALAPFWGQGRLAVLHGVGSPVATRSHFDAQDFMETGRPGDKRATSGWLNRATGLLGHEATPFSTVSVTPALPLALRGDAPTLAIADLDTFGVGAAGSLAGESLEALYARTSRDLLSQSGREGLDAARALEAARTGRLAAPAAEYPRSPLGDSLRQIAQLIKADLGLEIAFAEAGGWDTHARQGARRGTFARRAGDLADSIAAFWSDIEAYHDDVVVMTMTEFGRTVAANGTGGTDHGRASALFVLGNAAAGGQVWGEPLALAPDALDDGRDLAVTTDFRAAFAGVAGAHLGVPTDERLFPGWTGTPLGLVRG